MRYLDLYDNRIIKIENLDNLINLEVLDLSYNNIKVIENLSHLTNLKKLFLLSNKIKKVFFIFFYKNYIDLKSEFLKPYYVRIRGK